MCDLYRRYLVRKSVSVFKALMMDITITEIMDDLRAADEITRRFERK
jgi:hypothetical protein